MAVFLIVLLTICLFGIKFSFKNGFDDYMSPQKCNSIKGIFIFIVLLSHTRKFIKFPSTPLNDSFLEIISFIGQLMVVMFLFYSGYGIALGIKNKKGYTLSILTKRFPKVLLHFDIAVLIFYFFSMALGNTYSIKNLLLSFIGLSNVGNIVWYIFVTFILYILTFAVFMVFRKNFIVGTTVFTFVSAAAAYIMYLWKGNEHWWYDTIMCFTLGMWFAILKPFIDKLMLNNFNIWLVFTSLSGLCFAALAYLMEQNGRVMHLFIPAALILAIFIVLISMRISINNKLLSWLGNHLFGLYILHYIPMKLLTHYELNNNPILFTAISIMASALLAWIFEFLMNKLDIVLKLNKKK